ncbi:carboxymuconolactone decarboxylase family protein [Algihabitans albus]|uniref:carboxymuconolactone decarboxylase family protein n=1 Tax=Algihabitans albus TaxID=2164067 RepID=UPI000E5CEE11|nr:carboxymuconolactone decarboxylase family protein [Algihabitans albus]
MARVSPVPSSALPPRIAEIFEAYAGTYGPFRNQVEVMAHVPAAVEHIPALLMDLKREKAVPWRYIELAIVVVSKLNDCEYCVAHHAPVLEVEGVSQAGIARILDYDDHPELDEADRVVIEYAIQVTQTPQRIRDRMFERLRAHFTEAQIVELTLRIALCGFFNRFNDALMIQMETEAEQA